MHNDKLSNHDAELLHYFGVNRNLERHLIQENTHAILQAAIKLFSQLPEPQRDDEGDWSAVHDADVTLILPKLGQVTCGLVSVLEWQEQTNRMCHDIFLFDTKYELLSRKHPLFDEERSAASFDWTLSAGKLAERVCSVYPHSSVIESGVQVRREFESCGIATALSYMIKNAITQLLQFRTACGGEVLPLAMQSIIRDISVPKNPKHQHILGFSSRRAQELGYAPVKNTAGSFEMYFC